jgi:hypothetical protein
VLPEQFSIFKVQKPAGISKHLQHQHPSSVDSRLKESNGNTFPIAQRLSIQTVVFANFFPQIFWKITMLDPQFALELKTEESGNSSQLVVN